MRECLDEGTLQSYFDRELFGERMESASLHLASCSNCALAAQDLQRELGLVAAAFVPEFSDAVPTERLRQRIDAAIAGLPYETKATAPVGAASGDWWPSFAALVALTPQRAFGYAGLAAVLAFAAIFGVIQLRQGNPSVQNPELVAKATNPPVTKTLGVEDTAATVAQAPAPVIVVATPKARFERPVFRNASFKSQPVKASNAVANVKLLPGERSYLKTIAALDSTIKSTTNLPMRPALQAEYERNLALVDRALAATRDAAKKNPNDPDAAEFMFTAYQNKVNLLNTVADARSFNRYD
ncbi:MAG: hypothetical protein ABI967_12490 [bacterium]